VDARRLLNAGSYSSRSLVSELAAMEPALAGIHLYTFNNVETQPAMNWSAGEDSKAS
jgi:methylenetetrahydrofolate reductase (NADPH)